MRFRRTRGAPASQVTGDLDRLIHLRKAAESADLEYEGVYLRGPLQSRPEWEAELAHKLGEARQAWRAYAEAVFAESD